VQDVGQNQNRNWEWRAVYQVSSQVTDRTGCFRLCRFYQGTGEQIIRSSLAQSIAEALFTTAFQEGEFDTHSVLEDLFTGRLKGNTHQHHLVHYNL
jgi:hypothetical protein